MSLTTLFQVKRWGEYDYIMPTKPTVANKEPDYLDGETWLAEDTGFSFELVDQVAGTWVQIEKKLDNKTNVLIPSVEESTFAYLKNFFSVPRQKEYTGDVYGYWTRADYLFFLGIECLFSDFEFDNTGGQVKPTTKAYGVPTDWAAGDVVRVVGSKRNDDRFITLTAVNESTVVLDTSSALKDEVSGGCFVFLTDIPQAVLDTIGRMVYFDVAERNAIGLKSEKVGTYSWTRDDVRVGGIGYPDEIVGTLDQYASVINGGTAENPGILGGRHGTF